MFNDKSSVYAPKLICTFREAKRFESIIVRLNLMTLKCRMQIL